MVLTIILIWLGAVVIGLAGAAAATSSRWTAALALIAIAGIFSMTILNGLKGDFAVALIEAGDVYVWLTMLGPVVMWSLLGVGTSIAFWKQRGRIAAT